MNLNRRSVEMQRLAEEGSPRGSTEQSRNPRQNFSRIKSYDSADQQVDQTAATTDDATFERVFQHVDDFASDGLRTLLYGSRYIDDNTYNEWREIYHEAETSLVDRQEKIEEASDLIEQNFDLVGATAIEDKLQDGVPDTIDKLRRANIKIWMLTGDKRETAINIGHSAGLCKTFSQVYVLDYALDNLQETLSTTLDEISTGKIPHTVLVVDGQTLQVINEDDGYATLFYDITVLVDSVICCRASPAQKADLVKRIRRFVPKSMTLAIGDGANDIGMILASHVGIGISGREGLQAARISDFSFAQFRFLQKLLFVHGRWNYLRTGKYILATFWKEILFYLVQAHYQRSNGYSGTSLYENWSLTVFNILFTSLAVIIPGIFDKDLDADTLLAVPELYTFGQNNMGFNYYQYFGWALMGVIASVITFYPTWWFYHYTLFTSDNSIYAMGCVCFTVAVAFINIKLL
jgi:phospholipid-translocating ATPase